MPQHDLASFILERLAEEEFVARAAGGNRWAMMADLDEVAVFAERKPGSEVEGKGWSDVAWWLRWDDAFAIEMTLTDVVPFADHIARHNPARVLADIEAKRWLVGGHASYTYDDGKLACSGCDNYDPTGLHSHDEPYPCEVLRRLAQVYANHEDYLPEWKP